MTNCCVTEGTNKYFSRHARRYDKRYRRRGLDKPSRMIADALTGHGIGGKTILEIGCGAGGLHLTLLQRGARSSQGVEIAEGMVNAARSLAAGMGLTDRVTYHLGDFVAMNGVIRSADVVIMDKVICCYPDFEELIAKSTARAGALYAVSYPRDGLIPRVIVGWMGWLGRRFKWSFHPYYHSPEDIQSAIRKNGFREVFAGTTILWDVRVFQREKKE